MLNNTCCFFGHRTINETEELKAKITEEIERLITEKKVDTFLFGSKSQFDALCLKLVTFLKEKYPHIKRVYVRAEFPVISDTYKAYLLKSYDDTYFSEKLIAAGKASYVKRNYEMIDKSRFCIFYYDKSYAPIKGKSGTGIALEYAVKKEKEIAVFDLY